MMVTFFFAASAVISFALAVAAVKTWADEGRRFKFSTMVKLFAVSMVVSMACCWIADYRMGYGNCSIRAEGSE